MISESVAWRLTTHCRSPISFHYAIYRWLRIKPGQHANNLNSRLGPALDPKPFSLARWTRPIHVQQDGAWKGIGEAHRQAQNLKIWTDASDLSWTPSRVHLPIEPALFAFSKMVHGKELGSHHWSASLLPADSLMMIVSLQIIAKCRTNKN